MMSVLNLYFTLDEALHSPLAQQRGWTVEVPIQQECRTN